MARGGRESWRVFNPQCIVQRMVTLETRLDAMNRLGRAMADPTRSRILLRLVDGAAYPAALAEELGLSRSNVSNHLACLRGCGLVVGVPQGRQMRYELADSALARGLRELLEVKLAVDECPICQGACTHEVGPVTTAHASPEVGSRG